ncbi:MAG: PTS sugar transporter subunit IIA [Lentisphaeraceae bacterium]|nr:PTS sugar transporter subunit IIA [Lentisphaeraceae bacterium]
MNILDYSDPTRICFLKSSDMKSALEELVTSSSEYLYDKGAFLNSLIEREELMSTGMGFEIAFPHSKNDFVVDFFLTIGISSAGINWNSFDGKDVKLVFLIGGLVQQQDKYLRILSSLANLVKKEANKSKLLSAQSENEFYSIFSKLALEENQAV